MCTNEKQLPVSFNINQKELLQWVLQSISSSAGSLNSNQKRERDKDSDVDFSECFDTDSEFDSVSECGGKKRKLQTHSKDEVLNLICEWKDCQYTSTVVERFVHHVANHVTDLDVKISSDSKNIETNNIDGSNNKNNVIEDGDKKEDDTCEKGVYVCKWKHCGYENDSTPIIIKHVNYHAYHTKLKCIGANLRGKIKLPYTRVEDGCYRLQMVRYECIDEEEGGASDLVTEEAELPSKDYKIKINTDSRIPNIEIYEDNGDDSNTELEVNTDVEDSVGKSMPIISNILISIDEVDEDGNIINHQVFEAQETETLPSSDGLPVILGV
ncbi:hypothetical protein G9C98_001460 [Cotesia typhae]|uniref:C2H2-type domain-containing protein n=1 Tax=Cotesia typhae TaxID=2053667 RepID=A0A8J5R2G6_9HYME|nr:hypothetical protein G9C98_001460 [Cotesia typhae]